MNLWCKMECRKEVAMLMALWERVEGRKVSFPDSWFDFLSKLGSLSRIERHHGMVGGSHGDHIGCYYPRRGETRFIEAASLFGDVAHSVRWLSGILTPDFPSF